MCVAFRLMIGLDVISFTLEEKIIILMTTNTTTNMTFSMTSANIYENKSNLYYENIYACNQQCASPLQYCMNGTKTHKW